MLMVLWQIWQVAESRERRTPWQQEMVAFASQHEIQLVDLVPEFHKLADQHGSQALYLDQGHATALGNQHIGAVIADMIQHQVTDPAKQLP